MESVTKGRGIGRRIYAIVFGVIAAVLLYAGLQLALLGGSLYYLVAGIALAASAVLIWRGRREGVWIYGAIVLATIAWAIWEVGFSGWELMPRIVAWLVVGAWMLTPMFKRSLLPATPGRERKVGFGKFVLGAVAAVIVGAILHPFHPKPFDPIFQAGVGSFPEAAAGNAGALSGEWPIWGNNAGGSRFSPLTQITPANVKNLKVLWRASMSHTALGDDAGLEVTPLMIGDSLYACNNANEVYAFDAETGKQRWHVDTAKIADKKGRTCRGVAYYRVPGATGPCSERIISATGITTLVALDARTGQACSGFGAGGTVNLLDGLTEAPRGYYYVTSAPTIVRGKVVVGGWVSDGQYWGEPSGVIRAFDAVTGKLAWAWDMARQDRTGAPAAGEHYTPGTPNSWAPMSADEQLGMVYLPTGNATPDYVGIQRRPIDDQFSSSVVALDAETGRLRWSFQTVHHDVWDYDVASQPMLLDLKTKEGRVPALVQMTKRGEIFVLNRTNGQPIRKVVEKAAPQAGKAPGERLSPTQPFSVEMPSFRSADIQESDMWGITPLDQVYCRIKFRQARYDGPVTPPGLTPSIESPGTLGGMNWGSGSIDPERGVLVVNTTKFANYVKLLRRKEADALGLKPFGADANPKDIGGPVAQQGTPYGVDISFFMSPLYVPCQAPPFGFLSAVDLTTGKLIWSHPLGTAEDSGPLGIGTHLPIPLGTPTTGGSMTTRSGITFIGGTLDRKFRAYDVRTGRELWKASVTRGVFGTPMTYRSPKTGRQIVIVADGGPHAMRKASGAELIAYGLPQ